MPNDVKNDPHGLGRVQLNNLNLQSQDRDRKLLALATIAFIALCIFTICQGGDFGYLMAGVNGLGALLSMGLTYQAHKKREKLKRELNILEENNETLYSLVNLRKDLPNMISSYIFRFLF